MGLRKTFLMNITVRLYGSGSFICRPDTTWERESRDFFSPEFVGDIWYSPAVFARISKAGKFIGRKFAHRYYDGVNFGILLYPGEMLNTGKPDSIASASVLDHSSILPFPMYQPDVFRKEENAFVFRKNGDMLFRTGAGVGMIAKIEDTVSEASTVISQRIGDLIAVEMDKTQELFPINEKRAEISAEFCDSLLFRLSLIR